MWRRDGKLASHRDRLLNAGLVDKRDVGSMLSAAEAALVHSRADERSKSCFRQLTTGLDLQARRAIWESCVRTRTIGVSPRT